MALKKILADNLTALMKHHGIRSNAALAKMSGIDPTSVGRIRRCTNYAQIDKVQAIAKAFQLEAWQLLVPGLDPANPPVYMSTTERKFYERIKQAVSSPQ